MGKVEVDVGVFGVVDESDFRDGDLEVEERREGVGRGGGVFSGEGGEAAGAWSEGFTTFLSGIHVHSM